MGRIKEHPILGEAPEKKKVTFRFDGKTMEGYEGEPIAAALKAEGVMVHRYTKKRHEPRGIFCAIGRCTDCVMIVDGKPNVRTCITPLKEGMTVQTQYGVQAKENGKEGFDEKRYVILSANADRSSGRWCGWKNSCRRL